MKQNIILPLNEKTIKKLRAGDEVEITGTIYTARDAAHKRICETISNKRKLPFCLKGAVIYYTGPTPAKEGMVTGSCGPTTSARMDAYTPILLRKGLKGMIGKGRRSRQVVDAVRRSGAVYFITYGGLGAYLNRFVKKAVLVCYPDLVPESVYRFEVENFPAVVGIDRMGRTIGKQ